MTKEAVMEDLVKRTAPAASEDGAAGVGGGGGGGGQQDMWKDVELDQLTMFSWTMILTVLCVALFLGLVCLVGLCCCWSRNSANKKKKHYFGIKKTGYFRDKMMSSRPARNPTPVSNPDKGSHYLKKSPSPTGVKSPPGASGGSGSSSTGATAEEYLQRKAMITSSQQVKVSSNGTGGASGYADSSANVSSSAAAAAVAADLTSVTPTNETQPGAGSMLRRSSSGGMMDLVGVGGVGAGGVDSSTLGTMHCTIKYCFDKTALIITIGRLINLPIKDSTAKSSDPYVKLQLLPEKQHKVKTRVMRRTLNPVYDEDFTFYGIQFEQLQTLTLHFVVLSFDRYSRDDVIGEVMVDLEQLDDLGSSDQHPISIAREITPRSFKLKTQGRGEILVSLCYQPAANRITVVVLKARNLPKMDITGFSDPYVKIYLLCDGQRVAKKKTHVKKRTLNPVFNESFVLDLPPGVGGDEDMIRSISIEFLLLDWDRVTKNEVIGRLELGGPQCTGSALHHWNEVIALPRRQMAEWHKLQE